MSFRVIRVSEDYGVVVVVSPEDAGPDTPHASFWVHNDNTQEESEKFFAAASKAEVLGYFSGHADGLGWGNRPAEQFESLTAIEEWAEKSATRASCETTIQAFAACENLSDFYELFAEETDPRAIRHYLEFGTPPSVPADRYTKMVELFAHSPAAESDDELASYLSALLKSI